MHAEAGRGIGPVTTATTTTAAGAVVLVWVASLFGIELPEAVAGGLVVLAVLAAGYFTPGRGRRRAVDDAA